MNEKMAVFVLVERELRRFWRSKSRLVSSIIQPLFLLIALGGGLSAAVIMKGYGGTYFEFMAPGIAIMSVVSTGLFLGVSVIWDRMFGFMKEILVAPISRVSIALGKAIGGAIIATLNGVIVLIIGMAFGVIQPSFVFLPLVLAMFITGLIFACFGISMASIIEDMQAFQLISNLLFTPMIFLSGAFYPLSNAPDPLKYASMINPMAYPVDLARGLITGVFYFPPFVDVLMLLLLFAVSLSMASYLFNKIKAEI